MFLPVWDQMCLTKYFTYQVSLGSISKENTVMYFYLWSLRIYCTGAAPLSLLPDSVNKIITRQKSSFIPKPCLSFHLHGNSSYTVNSRFYWLNLPVIWLVNFEQLVLMISCREGLNQKRSQVTVIKLYSYDQQVSQPVLLHKVIHYNTPPKSN